jgi:hypothetical protein
LLMLQCFLKKHWSLGMLLASWKINWNFSLGWL